MCKKLSRYLPFTLVVIFAALIMLHLPCQAAEPDLIITGTGVYEEVVIYPGDWGKYAYAAVERLYSSNNALNFHHIWKVWGYDLFGLIGADNLRTQNYTITFYAKDGTKLQRTIGDLRSRYYYPKFTESAKDGAGLIAPMVGFKRVDLYECQSQDEDGKPIPPNPADVNWEDKPVANDDRAPRLYFGQAAGNVSDKNMTFFLYNLSRIVVGEERPASSGEGQTTDPKTGESTSEKPGEEKDPGSSKTEKTDERGDSKAKKDEETVASKEENSEDKENDKNNGDEEDENGTDVVAPGLEAEEGPDTDESPGEATRKARWPWLAAGAVVVAGLVGGGTYYYIRRWKA